MLGAIFTTALMTSCAVEDNPSTTIAPTISGSEPFILEDEMDRSVKPGDSFYHFAVGGWIQNHSEQDLTWNAQGSQLVANMAKSAILNSQDPEIMHILANMAKESDAFTEVATVAGVINGAMFDENQQFDLLNGWGRLTAKGFVTPITTSLTPSDNMIYNVVTAGVNKIESQLRTAGMESQLLKIITSSITPFIEQGQDIEEATQKVFGFANKVWAAKNDQLTGDLKQRFQGVKQPQYDLSKFNGRRGASLTIDSNTLKEVFGLVDGRDKIDNKVLNLCDVVANEDPQTLYLYTAYTVMAQNYFFMPAFRGLDVTDDAIFAEMLTSAKNVSYSLFNRAEAQGMAAICSKEACLADMEKLRTKMAARLQDLEWMGDATKQAALQKLQQMQFNAGVPEDIIGLDAFHLTGQSLLEDMLQLREQNQTFKNTYLGQTSYGKMDVFIQLESQLSEFNAFYAKDFNALYIMPAFCSFAMYPQGDDLASVLHRYATFYVFGHELCHGFDAKGAQYDGLGYKKDWWAPVDKQKFEEKQQQMIARFNELEAYPGQPANGKLTLEENMADLGGIRLSFELFNDLMKENGYEGKELEHMQREFFLHYAQVWKENERPLNELIILYNNDNHSNAVNRINGMTRIIDEWYDLFEVKDGACFVQPSDRPRIW